MRMSRKIIYSVAALTAAALFTPGLPAFATANFPTLFGPFTGDCTTPTASNPTITCTKSNGNSFASMAFQAASGVAITGGSIDGTTIGGTVRAAISATTGSFNGAVSGVANAFTGLSTQTGGHVVGTADLTAAATLTAAQEDVCANLAAAATITLPATPANGQRVVVSDCTGTAGLVTVAASSGQKILTSSGQAQSLAYANAYQSATYTYHSTGTLWTIE